MKADELMRLGIPRGKPLEAAYAALREHSGHYENTREALAAVARQPEAYLQHEHFGPLAEALLNAPPPIGDTKCDYETWGEGIDAEAHKQMANACRLPVATRGALMPDAHLGYGLPVGGVLACENAVIPYAVGVDIACRMRLTIFDVPADQLNKRRDVLRNALLRETVFGVGVGHKKPLEHDVLDEDWSVSAITRRNFEKARNQLGTSGSGNHFVEWGTLTLPHDDLVLPAGTYVALLSHSGSRGVGAAVCNEYSKRAMHAHRDLPASMKHLAWLGLDTADGHEYWNAMNLMGRYAAANHELIHKRVAKAAGLKAATVVENHHNFAWIEEHEGKKVVVHRKGATPAGEGVLGVIPGSMATPGYVVRGKGNAASLQSASHGAGRVMSRKQAKNTYRWNHVKPTLEAAGVELLSAGIDENPHVYKDIHAVMAAQTDLVDVIGRFDPKMVRMADDGKAED